MFMRTYFPYLCAKCDLCRCGIITVHVRLFRVCVGPIVFYVFFIVC